MGLFWALWIPLNIIFWVNCASNVKDGNPTTLHFKVALGMAAITGALPWLIWMISTR